MNRKIDCQIEAYSSVGSLLTISSCSERYSSCKRRWLHLLIADIKYSLIGQSSVGSNNHKTALSNQNSTKKKLATDEGMRDCVYYIHYEKLMKTWWLWLSMSFLKSQKKNWLILKHLDSHVYVRMNGDILVIVRKKKWNENSPVARLPARPERKTESFGKQPASCLRPVCKLLHWHIHTEFDTQRILIVVDYELLITLLSFYK